MRLSEVLEALAASVKETECFRDLSDSSVDTSANVHVVAVVSDSTPHEITQEAIEFGRDHECDNDYKAMCLFTKVASLKQGATVVQHTLAISFMDLGES